MRGNIYRILVVLLIATLSVGARRRKGSARALCSGQGNGTFLANNSSCSSFFVCYNEEAVQQECEPGSYFDSENLYCVPDTDNICDNSTCSENGTFSANPDNCASFFICYNRQLVEQSCEAGSYFNQTSLYCVPDEEGVCPQGQCTTNGSFSPHPTDCNLFNVCYNGEHVEQSCGEGSYFNPDVLYCEPDTNNTCETSATTTLSPCSCPGGYENGEYAPHPDSCYLYYVCSNGELSTYCCGDGYLFNAETKECELDTEGTCWPITESPSCTCPGGYQEGEQVANEESCDSYYVCTQGKLVDKTCDSGKYFDAASKSCICDYDGICRKEGGDDTTTTESN